MILPIYLYGTSVLRQEAEDIEQDYPGLQKLIKDMFETMYNSEGVGLAAPQTGKSIAVIVIDASVLAEDFPECANSKMVLINPQMEVIEDGELVSRSEGCLSLPGISEPVRRPTRIRVKYLDREWNEHDEWVEGYLARVMQHEFDHLEGKVFTDRISPLRKQLIKKKMANLLAGKFSCSYKTKRK